VLLDHRLCDGIESTRVKDVMWGREALYLKRGVLVTRRQSLERHVACEPSRSTYVLDDAGCVKKSTFPRSQGSKMAGLN
jgi:hypothetical protein